MNVNHLPTDNVPQEVFDILNDIGIPQHLKGYPQVAYAISLILNAMPDRLSLTKELYPTVARAYNCNSSNSVERAIRHCVDSLFTEGDYDLLYKYFGNSISKDKGKVSNSQFMYTIANIVHKKLLDNVK